MSVTINVHPTLTGILPEPNNDKKFRYYHCLLTTTGDWTCEERFKMTIPGEPLAHVATNIHPDNISKCIPVHSNIPKIFDPLILKYNNIPKVEIKK